MMETILAPGYYRKFKCVADKCRHSCCIDWEIRIDDQTYEKYTQIEEILATVEDCDGEHCFKLTESGRCPHLDDSGLCKIILTRGESFLSEICQNHPRFFNEVNGRLEAGLGIVCEEACRLILEDGEPFSLVKIGERERVDEQSSDFNPIPPRARIMELIEASASLDSCIAALKRELEIPELCSPEEWLERFFELEILDESWELALRESEGNFLRKSENPAPEYEKYYARLLKYFVYRHVSAAKNPINLRARLGFAMLLTEAIRSLHEASGERSLERLIETARLASAELEYSEDNTDELIFAFESRIRAL